jgi:hypothetical protein
VSPTESEHVQGDAASIKEAIHNWLENLPYGVTKPRAASRFNGSPYLVAKGLWMNRVEFMKSPTFRTANEVLTSRNGKFIDSKAEGKVFWRVTYTLDFPWLEVKTSMTSRKWWETLLMRSMSTSTESLLG